MVLAPMPELISIKPRRRKRHSPSVPLPKPFTLDELIEFSTVPEAVIRRDLRSGRLRGCKFTRQVIVFRQEDVDSWLDSYATQPEEATR